MRILLTNDDGIHAPGLAVLEAIAGEFPTTYSSSRRRATSRASPTRCRSAIRCGCAKSARGTTRSKARRPTASSWACGRSWPTGEPDLVLSGVNRGQNVAEDVTYSGTIAGAMEGAILGIPSIALSQAYGGAQGRASIEWDATEAHAAPLIRKILAAGIAPGGLVNVNFPACRPDEVVGVAFTRQGQRNAELMRVEERRDGRGFPYYWLMFMRGEIRFEDGTDLAALARGKISVTPLRLDLTDDEFAPAIREGFRAAMMRIK